MSPPAPVSTPPSPVPETLEAPQVSLTTQIQALFQQFLTLEVTYRAQLRAIEEEYEHALAQATRAPGSSHQRRLWKAYAQARRKQQEVYRAVQRQWDALFATYRQVVQQHMAAQH